ncbi:rod shape-determining protein [Yinghuangia seranimata]|uniref:rod shape-determining protein n=1 Tax=Yinghuangia seranimata TaxID=408067 RepID=UPI00248C521C|nr:rod shape-determining protein [Yinghuangia seranimata]MDI2125611.1 rod shape-determining protein [Yinghuangia seranimata]
MAVDTERLRRCRVAVDLGSSRVRVALRGKGLVVDAPSAVAIDLRSGKVVAAGDAAATLDGRSPDHIRVSRPLLGGAVVQPDIVGEMLRCMLGKHRVVSAAGRFGRDAVTAMPQHLSADNRGAVKTALGRIGLRHVEMVEAPLAAGVGCGVPLHDPSPAVVAVCGASMTQVAVLSSAYSLFTETLHVGGDEIARTVEEHLRRRYWVAVSAERVRGLVAALDRAGPGTKTVRCWDLRENRPSNMDVDIEELREAVGPLLALVSGAVRRVMERCTPDVVVDVADRGVVLTGGAARFEALPGLIRDATGMPVHVPAEPDLAVIRGLERLMGGTSADLPAAGELMRDPVPEPS